MELLLEAVCQFECSLSDIYTDCDELERIQDELITAWRVLLNRWGHLIDDETVVQKMTQVRGLPS